MIFLVSHTGSVVAGTDPIDKDDSKFKNASAPAVAVSSAVEHNIIRDALSQQKTINNLGYSLSDSYDFSEQPAPAQALPELKDSQAMQESAAQHAQACKFEHNSSPYGQNLFAGTGTSWTIEHAVNSWADEARYYDFETNGCMTGEQCGHYTQLIWEDSREVGCVIKACDQMTGANGNVIFDGRSGVMIFCHYDPAGNVRSEMAYRKASDVPRVDLAFSMKVMLQGVYNPVDGLMRRSPTNLELATDEPYSGLGHTVSGVRSLNSSLMSNSGNDAIVDWVLVELRRADDPAQTVDSIVAVVQRDGDLMHPDSGSTALVFENQLAGDYYLSVRHRNHLGVMTSQSLPMSASPVTVDFSAPSTPVWGQHARLDVSGTAVLRAGDVNYDGRIIGDGTTNDAGLILGAVLLAEGNDGYAANFIAQGYGIADVNLDAKVIYAGVGNDVNFIRSNVLLHPGNTLNLSNFIITQQLP